MPSTFPTTLDAFTNPSPASSLQGVNVSHALQHSDANDAIELLEAKLGIDSSAVATAIDYFLKHASGNFRTHVHAGGANDGAIVPLTNVSGTLPVPRGGTNIGSFSQGDVLYA